MNKKIFFLTTLLSFLALSSGGHARPHVTGWIENIKIYPEQAQLAAKLDTGAKMSSIDATHIEQFTRQKQPWVRFTVRTKNKNITLEKPMVGKTKIKLRRIAQRITHKVYTHRPVVSMDICLAGERQVTEVNLADRKHFAYPFLVGRNTIRRFHRVIDPKRKHLTKPQC